MTTQEITELLEEVESLRIDRIDELHDLLMEAIERKGEAK